MKLVHSALTTSREKIKRLFSLEKQEHKGLNVIRYLIRTFRVTFAIPIILMIRVNDVKMYLFKRYLQASDKHIQFHKSYALYF